jgi:DNA mismatch endonuclease, patch repair protein
MARIKGKDTGPEKAVRSILHALGYRFRLHRRSLPGSPDIVFPGRKAVVCVHGCFWHGHGCKQASYAPKSNADFWSRKLTQNIARDARTRAELEALGWRVLVVWECEIKKSVIIAERLQAFLENQTNT